MFKTADGRPFQEGDLLFGYYNMRPVVVGGIETDRDSGFYGWATCFEFDAETGERVGSAQLNGERLCSFDHAVHMGWMTKDQVRSFELYREQLGSNVAHDCLRDEKLKFVASYAAPGIGQSWECEVCGRSWAKVGGSFHDPGEGAHILDPEDVI